ncbi:MAG TPA: TraB/GumN family protein [Lysobacter sp.]
MRTGLAPAMLALSIAFATAPVAAQQPLPPIRDMETLVVSGIQPGPGMWKVSRDDHTLYVLGTLSPLPKRMEWESRDVENVIAQAQEVIEAPSVRIDSNIGIFQRLLLAPKALGARKNPNGETLQQAVPPDMYARWQVLKRKYMGNDRSVEEWRPMLAALELYNEAMDDIGLKQYGIVSPVVEKMARRHKVPLTTTRVTIVIEDPKVALQEFRESKLDDVDCFGKTMQRLESDLDMMRERANAWAVGDIATLKSLPYTDQNEVCLRAVSQAAVLRKRTGDIEAQVRERWLDAAELALKNNRVSLGVLPMRELLKPDGYISQLRAKGYTIEEP